ncbi:hypothetical protein AB0H83_05455 [Dactylosporangium sp. NPDC050688]|uniref:hypothetical protein n=1 Tax=Dactylosporangium sp. NPDC050688 TaxID=3157217 RepID=UPI0033CF8812
MTVPTRRPHRSPRPAPPSCHQAVTRRPSPAGRGGGDGAAAEEINAGRLTAERAPKVIIATLLPAFAPAGGSASR